MVSKTFYITRVKTLLFFLSLITSLHAISLEQAVFQALQTHPEIKEKEHALGGVKNERDLVTSGYYPKLYISAGSGVAREEITPQYTNQTGDQISRTDASITASMNLFQGFYTRYDVESQKYRSSAASATLLETKSLIVMRMIESYIMMMKHKAIFAISRENVASHRDIYNKLKEKSESGMGKASDLGFASGRLTLAEVNAVVHENNFIQSKVNFETLLGASVDVAQLEEPIFDYTLPKTLEDAALMALDYNPSIMTGKQNIKSAQSSYQRSQSVQYPTLDLELKRSLMEDTGGYDYSVNSSYAMIYLRYNLFNGFTDKASIQREFANVMQSNEYFSQIKRDVTKQLATAWIGVIKIKEQLDLLEKMRRLSKTTLEDYYTEFGIGKRTLLDIINVKNDYNNARQSYESAKYDLLLAKFRILSAMGGVVEYFEAKSQKKDLQLQANRVEDQSVYGIIKEMDGILKEKKDFLPFKEQNGTGFDAVTPKDEFNFDE